MASDQRFFEIEPVNDYNGAGTTKAEWPHLIAFMAVYAIYALCCAWYEYREISAQKDCTPLLTKSRNFKWDVIKLVLLGAVIILHTDQAVYGLGHKDLNKYHYLIRYNLGAFALSSFSFVSGVFGDSTDRKSKAKMTCSLIGAAIFTSLICDLILLVTPGEKKPLYIHDMVWYLIALCVWRWTVSPLFHVLENHAIPPLLSWFCMFCACYCLAQGVSFHSEFYWGYFAFWFYTPFFALGRCMRRETWTNLLDNKYLITAAAVSLPLWSFVSLWWEEFQEWNDVICVSSKCSRRAWPGPKSSDGLHIAGFLDACRVFLLKAWVSFSVVWLVAATTPEQPAFKSILAGCGTRTIYGYVLHIVVHVYLGVRLGLPLILEWLPEWVGLGLLLAMCILSLFVWCSQLTKYLFSWMVEPLWTLKLMCISE